VPNPSLPKTLELIKKSSPLGWGISGERISLSFEKDRIVTASADLISVLNLSGTILRQFKIPRELRGVFSVHLVGLETIAVILVNDVYFLKDSGALISKYSLPAPLGGQPISKDRLLVWTKDKAINFNSQGEAQFEYDCSGGCIEINRPSLTGEGQIALPVQGRVDLLDASSGQWTKSIFGSGSSAAQVHPDGGLVFACIDQKYGLCRLSPKASESWQVNREGDRRVNWFKVLADGNIAVRFEGDQGFQILDAHTGAARYSVPISAPFEFKGALSNGVIVIEDSVYRGLRFFDGLSGSELARTKEASFLFPLPDNTFVLALAEGSFDSVLGWFRLK
jgi:hypothetical protein